MKTEFAIEMGNDHFTGEPTELSPDRTDIGRQNIDGLQPDVQWLLARIWLERNARRRQFDGPADQHGHRAALSCECFACVVHSRNVAAYNFSASSPAGSEATCA